MNNNCVAKGHRWLMGFVFCLSSILSCPSLTAGDGFRRRVLILNSYHHGFKGGESIQENIERELTKKGGDFDFSCEYLDTKKNSPTPEYYNKFADLFQIKYASWTPDLIFACDDNAFRFLARYRSRIFPDIPVVFTGINNDSFTYQSLLPQSTGVVEAKDMEGNLRLALQLQGNVKKVVVVSDGTVSARLNLELFKRAVGRFPNLEVVELSGELVSMEQLKEGIRNLSDAFVFYVSFHRDKTGQTFHEAEIATVFSTYSSVPVYTHVDTLVGRGMLGGVVSSSQSLGKKAGQMGLRVLTGMPVADLSVESAEVKTLLDYDELMKWNIDFEKIPEAAVIVGRPAPTFYEEYRFRVWTVVSVFCLFVLLTISLAINMLYRWRASRALIRSERHYRQFVEVAPLPIIVQHDKKIAYVNAKAVELMEAKDKTDLIGRDIMDFLHSSSHSSYLKFVEHHEDHGPLEEVRTKFQAVGLAGAIRDLDTISILAEYEGKEAFLTMCRDITEELREKEERERIDTKMREVQRLESLGILAGGIAHDFNNLLVGILGNVSLIQEKFPEESAIMGMIEDISRTSRQAKALCEKMLDYSGEGRGEQTRFDLAAVVEDMGNMLRMTISKKTNLTFDSDANLPRMEGDVTQIQQVIMNLITNASEALENREGEVTLSVTSKLFAKGELADDYSHQPMAAGRYVRFEIKDTGCGMDEETRSRLFDPFYTTKFAGRGLGLAVVLGIIRSHKGTIHVHSRPGRGTRIQIFFPAIAAEDLRGLKTDEEQKTSLSRSEDTGKSAFRGTGKILLVDDEEIVLKVIVAMLTHLGYKVEAFSDGRQAIDAFQQDASSYLCAVLDLTMPHMSGEECLRKLREIRADIPILLSSGYSENDVSKTLAGEEKMDFVHKPFDVRGLEEKISLLVS